jgi:hypothetical protein
VKLGTVTNGVCIKYMPQQVQSAGQYPYRMITFLKSTGHTAAISSDGSEFRLAPTYSPTYMRCTPTTSLTITAEPTVEGDLGQDAYSTVSALVPVRPWLNLAVTSVSDIEWPTLPSMVNGEHTSILMPAAPVYSEGDHSSRLDIEAWTREPRTTVGMTQMVWPLSRPTASLLAYPECRYARVELEAVVTATGSYRSAFRQND